MKDLALTIKLRFHPVVRVAHRRVEPAHARADEFHVIGAHEDAQRCVFGARPGQGEGAGQQQEYKKRQLVASMDGGVAPAGSEGPAVHRNPAWPARFPGQRAPFICKSDSNELFKRLPLLLASPYAKSTATQQAKGERQ